MLHCVVFNSSHEPLAVVPAERGLILVLEGKAIILEERQDRKFRTVRQEFPIPKSIVLKEYRKTGAKYYGKADLNQRNLFVRDHHTCQYCLRSYLDLRPKEYLTRDHLHPQSKGGADEWTNVVTACSTCNHKKDDLSRAQIEALVVELENRQQAAQEARHDKQAEKLGLQAADWRKYLVKPPKEPTVFEIMENRSAKLRRVR